MNNLNFISIGGWCGTKIALKDLNLFNEPSLPFDSVRSSMEGVIDCIENNFANFFPKNIKKDPRFQNWVGFVGKYIGFYHFDHNLLNENVIAAFQRRFIRFDSKIKKGNCIFLRTIVADNCWDEIKLYKSFQNAVEKKYPGINYIICFIIPYQNKTMYYKNIDTKTFLFTLNDLSGNQDNLKNEYKPIFDIIKNINLFEHIPLENDILISVRPSRWLVDGYPMVNC
jgi:hypothetical protein